MRKIPQGSTKGTLQIRAKACFLGIMGFIVAAGCATYQTKVEGARSAMMRSQNGEALAALAPLASEDGNDRLVYLLDYATVLQRSGQYKESAKALNEAEKIADVQDYHSLSKVTSSLVLSEEMIQYKGDDYEKVLINAINAINYLEMGELDDALVEVRRLNQKLYKFKFEAKKDYQQNPFAFYLSAIIYEAGGKWDDAYIAYKKAHEVSPNYAPLREDLIRSAMRAERSEELEKWKRQFPEVQVRPEWRDRNLGEIILVYLQGWGPRKEPRPDAPRYPYLVPIYSQVRTAKLSVSGGNSFLSEALSQKIFSVQEVAIKTLEDDYARLVGSRVAGVVAKAIIAERLKKENELLGELAWMAMNASDRADVRQWSTLPETFQFARIRVPPGTYEVKVQGLSKGGYPVSEEMPARKVTVQPGKKAFISWRSVL